MWRSEPAASTARTPSRTVEAAHPHWRAHRLRRIGAVGMDLEPRLNAILCANLRALIRRWATARAADGIDTSIFLSAERIFDALIAMINEEDFTGTQMDFSMADVLYCLEGMANEQREDGARPTALHAPRIASRPLTHRWPRCMPWSPKETPHGW